MPLRAAVVYGGVPLDPRSRAAGGGRDPRGHARPPCSISLASAAANLARVEILVLDEAVQMLDMGFMPDIRRIMDLLLSRKQTLLFSATFSDDIKPLAGSISTDPVPIEVARHSCRRSETVRQLVYPVDRDRKENSSATSSSRATGTRCWSSRGRS
ncbi:MAG: DEAD/DEAH box helicase [Chloroflexota bacterium]